MRLKLVAVVLFLCVGQAAESRADMVAGLDWNASSGLLDVAVGGPGTGFSAISNLTNAIGIDGATGVLTSGDISLDPQLSFTGSSLFNVSLPSGFVGWESLEIRFRQLNGNPDLTAPIDNSGISSVPFSKNGTILLPVVDGTSFVVQGSTVDAPGSLLTSTTEATGDWVVWNYDLSGIASTSTVGINRFDPIGNTPAGNFEVDFVRVNAVAVPEPSSLALVGLAGTVACIRRHRRKSSMQIG